MRRRTFLGGLMAIVPTLRLPFQPPVQMAPPEVVPVTQATGVPGFVPGSPTEGTITFYLSNDDRLHGEANGRRFSIALFDQPDVIARVIHDLDRPIPYDSGRLRGATSY